jgi:hypothetical protein
VKASEAVHRGWDIVALTIRLLGMRGDINAPEVRRFVPILRRHAMRVDAEAYRSLRMGPRADLLTAPKELAALARRSRGFQKEFDAAEARRFKKNNLPFLEQFRKRVHDVAAGAFRSTDPEVCKVTLDRLRELRGSIPPPDPSQGSRWGREGNVVLDSAVRKVEDWLSSIRPTARMDAIAVAVAQIRSDQVSEKKRAIARAKKIGRKGGRPHNNPDVPQFELMRAMDRRVKAGLPRKVAVAEVFEFYKASGRPLQGSMQTLLRRYCAYRKRPSA